MTIKICIALLTCYFIAWGGILFLPFAELETELSNEIMFYLVIAEEVIIILCIMLAGKELINDIRKKSLR